MANKTRNTYLAQLINKLNRLYWFLARPKTRGVKVVIFDHQNKILMVRLTYYPNTWTFVGGGVDSKETPENAAKRESKEEVGIELKDIDFVTKLKFNFENKKDTVFVYKATVENTNVTIDHTEVAEAVWFDLSELPSMGKNAKRILASVLEGLV